MGKGTAGAQVVAGFAVDLARHGDAPALHAGGRSVSYAELNRRVADARTALESLTAQGRRHLVRLRPEPTVEFVVAWLAALTGGHATLLSRDPALAAAYGTSIEYDAGGWRPTGTLAPVLHPDLRLLLSTSGSTGSPKLVRLSAANLDANAAAIASYLGLREDDVALTTLPLDYCYGLSVLHSHLAAGASVLLDDRSVTEPGLWADARSHGVTSFAGVPYTFDLLGSTGWPQLPTLRQVTQAGGRMAPERVRALGAQGETEGWDLVVMYGQTEATARMAWLPPHLASTHPHAVGVAIPGGSFRLDPVEGAGPDVGELVYAGPNVMMGYAESPLDLARGADLDELRTGDLARISADGLVEIVGRRSRFAKLFGQRIDLDRVQTLLGLGGHDAGCAEASDAEQLVVAVPGEPDALVLAEVAATVSGDTGLPPHAVRVVPVADLPRLANGKLDQQALARLQPVPETGPGSPVQSLVRLYGRVLGRDVVGPQDSFVTLGGDSLSYVELSLRLEQRLGRLPSDWQRRTIADLALLDRTGDGADGAGGADGATRARRHRWFARVDTTIPLRALAIVMIVGSHTNLWVLVGGAHVLLAVAGANFARFHLTDEDSRERVRRVVRSAARIAVPSIAWIGAVHVATGMYPWRTVLLLNDVLGGADWSEPAWHFWFVEVVLLLALGAGLFASVPVVMALERRHRFGLAAALTALALVPRWWADLASYDGDVIHSSLFVAWLFAGGWAAAVARGVPQRAVAAGLLLLGTWDLTGDTRRDLIIAVGLLALVWLPTVPWPRVLVGATGTLASASLYIYLTHWQVYPRLEDHWPLGGLLASLAVGVLAWRVVERAQAASWAGLTDRIRPHYARHQLTRQEA
ncbi:acyl-CoA synthetase (AMP-forming)/AMP-acid ligase II [Nocardioides aromaticivorans]|uniref:Acyl-CoA synthetase (AMP-forming)/AMP-acid ligase II n=1 Tax=Nocardioides aromaticivorans TaxID=200618 RepID=A0A7Z0CLB4_9ACTN|nr:non-ribosomal peptide synthetase [Nocardioides aromaticivorans]NYI45601.1 acyl-CoA synthetase (AMP-forming)/AMP-acid ligase II [Nocardioides aromaticivorans]